MSSFIIEGGRKLSGSITPQGAKNEALEVLSAVLLTAEPVRMSNVPEIPKPSKPIIYSIFTLTEQLSVGIVKVLQNKE